MSLPAAPNRFQPILLRAMRAAAEESRNAMLAACRDDATTSVTNLHTRSAEGSETLRRLTAADVASIDEAAKAEMARIAAEAEAAIAARRADLGRGLEDGAARLEAEIDALRSRVAAFEAEMDAFFARLDAVGDPAQFAALTAQMPEPPQLRDGRYDLTTDARAAPAAASVAAVAQSAATSRLETRDRASADPPAETSPGQPTASPAPEVARADPSQPETTTIVVVGLVNIASIASFKRHVSSLRGIRAVAVSSGPGGEFMFKVTHEPDVALADEVTLLPGFGARVVASREGFLQVAARDPGAAA